MIAILRCKALRGFRQAIGLGLMVIGSSLGADKTHADGLSEDLFTDQVRPFLEQYCIDCHAEGSSEADVVLDQMFDAEDAARAGETWVRVLAVLDARSMPPTDAEQPSMLERQQVVDWIENDLIHSLATKQADAPAIVMRRLNRLELRNTLRDLLFIDANTGELPTDEIAFGFDNIGSVLNFTPVHFEKFFAAAEQATASAIWAPDVSEFAPIELIGLRTYPISPESPVDFEHSLAPGRYLAEFSLVRVGVSDSVPPPIVQVSFGTDSRTIKAVRVQDETVVYRFWIGVAEGDRLVNVSVSMEGDQELPSITNLVSGDQRYGDNIGLHVDSIVVRGPMVGPEQQETFLARFPGHRQIVIAEPGPGDAERRGAAEASIREFVRRAYRRPAEESEILRLLQLFDVAMVQGESFEHALQIVMSSVLASPKFLYLVEEVPEGSNCQLNEYELASRLSYFLWSSMPDEELFALADRGELRLNLRNEVARMLASPKIEAFIESFCGQWLQLRRLDEISPDPQLFPTFNASLRTAMRRESEEYFRYVLAENRSVLELIHSDYTFVDAALAEHYGLDTDDQTSEFQLVHFSNGQRGGLLTQASVLAITSNPNRTSPVKRGKWVLQQILGTPPPPPPPIVESLDDKESDSEASLRDRLLMHRKDPACASCHAQMDPIGFALENYDAIGRWREADDQFTIDASGSLPSGASFSGANHFKQLLAEDAQKRFCRCLIKNLLTYALGRGLELSDLRTVEDIRVKLSENDFRMQTIVHEIIMSEAFQSK